MQLTRPIQAAAQVATTESEPVRRQLIALREAVDKTVGQVFYGTLLKQLRASSIKGPYGHGGQGEAIFQGQLHQILAERAGQARSYDLNETMFQRLKEAQMRKVNARIERSNPA